MAARAISSGTISFGLVSIPVKLYSAASSEQARFNLLHGECGSRLKQQLVCPKHGEVGRKDVLKGYEYAKGQYVTFSEEELKALESVRSNSMEIVEFVPMSTVDFVQVERSYYLGPDKGGDKAYRLLSESMRATNRVAVGTWSARGKQQLILIRPYGKDGLIFHQLYYENEVRSFEDIDTGATFSFSEKEHELAQKLIEQLGAQQFDASKYSDTFSDKVRSAAEQKAAGQELSVLDAEPKAQIIDLFEALKRSLSDAPKPATVKKAEPRRRPAGKKADTA